MKKELVWGFTLTVQDAMHINMSKNYGVFVSSILNTLMKR